MMRRSSLAVTTASGQRLEDSDGDKDQYSDEYQMYQTSHIHHERTQRPKDNQDDYN